MKFPTLILLLLLLVVATFANAATTNINPHTVTSTHGFYEGRVSVGTLANLTSYQLFVTNDTLIGDDLTINDTTLTDDLQVVDKTNLQTLYVDSAATFNGTVSGIQAGSIDSGTIARARLPSELAYEDEANSYAVRQAFLDGATFAGYLYANDHTQFNGSLLSTGRSYFNAPALFNGTLTADEFAYIMKALQVNGTFTASANSYHDAPSRFNSTVNTFSLITGERSASTNGILAGQVTGDSSERLLIESGGRLLWGPGNAATDTTLERCTINLICTGSADALDVAGTFIASTNSYHEGSSLFNTTTFTQQADAVAVHTLSMAETSASAPAYRFDRSRGTIASPTNVANGDSIGTWQSRAYSNGFFPVAQINYEVDGTFTAGQRPPSRMTFFTNVANGAQVDNLILYGDGRLEMNGDLDHDGTEAGFLGATPRAVYNLDGTITDNTGGVGSQTCAAIAAGAIYTQADMTAVRNCLVSLIDDLNDMYSMLAAFGLAN